MFRNLMIALVMVCMSAWLVLAQTPADGTGTQAAKQAPIVMVEKIDPVQAAANATTGGQGTTGAEEEPAEVLQMDMSQAGEVTVDFRDADMRNVLKMLSYKSGVNIIAGPEVEGVVNMQLKDVPWQKALDVILSTYGYGYEQKGTVIMVTTIDNLKRRREDAKVLADQEPMATQTFLLNFGKAEDVLKALNAMKTARGNVNFDKRTNAIIVNDIESNIVLFREVVKKLDTVTPQVLIEAKIIETTLGKDDKLGVDWGLLAQAGGAMRSTPFPFASQSRGTFVPVPTATVPTDGPTLTYGTIDFRGLTAVLNMLKSRTNTNALSNPRIVTLDNQPAKISVGQQYPVPQYTYNEQQAKLQVSGWSYLDIGIIFNVTPHVNSANIVTLDIEPTITSIDRPVQVESTSMPLLNSESVKTSVMIKNGETLVIAGLIKDTVTKTVKRVPILGYIPILGLPFKNTVDAHVKTELLIFITPHIITPEVRPVVPKK
ncbi:MAG: secretin and TonB N-terminal domain-containing protein [Candidatus Omnitrophica bacterium]|nr:secretin and TonB N-terminal domain-containing protein [Candidatus Omnitrophota bacterium]